MSVEPPKIDRSGDLRVLQVSHIKIALRSKWGTTSLLFSQFEQARAEGVDITADVYPYTMWSSTPRVLFPNKDFTSLQSATFATTELSDPAASYMVNFSADTRYEGKTISEIAALNKETSPEALMRIIRETEAESGDASIAATSMSDKDVAAFIQWPHSNICSDGSDGGHPRGYGSFPRVLGRYVGEQKIIPLETAVYKMTGLTAEHLGITNRGLITKGYYADLVLFDPATVIDRSTITDSKALSEGIEMVWVNGRIVYQNKKATGVYPGVFVRRR